jgi:hypothetical protein
VVGVGVCDGCWCSPLLGNYVVQKDIASVGFEGMNMSFLLSRKMRRRSPKLLQHTPRTESGNDTINAVTCSKQPDETTYSHDQVQARTT